MNLVRFRTNQGVFLVPTTSVLEVRTSGEVQVLPGRKEGVAGLVEKDGRVLTVLSTLGPGGAHVLLLSSSGGSFGLLAEEVLGVVNVNESDIQPPPQGQSRALVSGAVKTRGRPELIVSPEALWQELQKDAPAAR